MINNKEETFRQMIHILNKAINNNELDGGNMMVLENGKEVFYHEDGFSDETKETRIKRKTIFRLYSMSKPIIAVGIMILMERGQIDLFDSVSQYLPGFKNQMVMTEDGFQAVKRDLNIKDLLNMTSGLLYGGEDLVGIETSKLLDEIGVRINSPKPMNTYEAMNALGALPLAFQPGQSWQYGLSADVLGGIIECVSHQRLGEFLSKEIFEPLNMVDTGFYVEDSKRDRLSQAYKGNNLSIYSKLDHPPAYESGGAGLVGTIEDYSHFASMLLNEGLYEGKRILKAQVVRFMTTSGLESQQEEGFSKWHTLAGHTYSNLMRIVKDPSQAGMLCKKGEYGWDGWLGCYFANFPNEKLSFLFMMQKVDSGTTSLTRKLRNILLSNIDKGDYSE